MGGFNADIEEKHMKCFFDNYDLKSLIKQSTCYKNPDNPTCIDLFLTNAPRWFSKYLCLRNLAVIFPSNDFDCYEKKNYGSHKNVSNEKFKSCLSNKLRKEDFIKNDEGFEKFCNISINVWNKYAP